MRCGTRNSQVQEMVLLHSEGEPVAPHSPHTSAHQHAACCTAHARILQDTLAPHMCHAVAELSGVNRRGNTEVSAVRRPMTP